VFDKIAGFGALLRQAQEMGGRLKGMREELRHLRATGEAGGGMVQVEVNGLFETLGVKIDPQLIGQNDREMLEDLLVTAFNQAVAKCKELNADAMKSVTGGLEVPGLEDAMSKLFGGAPPTA
jgi:DNA-binding YbaB/EbfC family protein